MGLVSSKCRKCGGSGIVSCTSCYGSGRKNSNLYLPDDHAGDCFACRGSGQVNCTECRGTGIVHEYEADNNGFNSNTTFSSSSSSGSTYSSSGSYGSTKSGRKKRGFWVKLIEAIVAAVILVGLGVEDAAPVVFLLVLIFGL